jgi:drug/metabolite transporter (DMT)-like permease
MSVPTPSSPKALEQTARPGKWVGVLFLGAATITLAPILLRYAIDCGVGEVAAAFWRVGIAAPLLFAWIMFRPRHRGALLSASPDRRAVLFAVLGGACFGVDLMLYYTALARTTIANATLMSNCAPVFVAVLAWMLLGERFKRTFIIGLVLALGGALVLSLAERATAQPRQLPYPDQERLGDILAISSAVFYAGYQLCMKRARRSLPVTKAFLLSMTTSAVVLFVASGVIDHPDLQTKGLTWSVHSAMIPSGPMKTVLIGWLVLAALGLLVQLGGQGSIVTATRHLPVSFSSVVLLAQPVMAGVLGWVLLGEVLGGWHFVGGAAVLAGIYLAQRGTNGARNREQGTRN